jgi:RHS repeat-associated protein
VTNYSHDAAGNLSGYTYPNGVQTSYNYDTLNRLTQMGAAKNGALSSYAYTLGAAGNRLTVAELSGRNVTYGYDSLYRLTSETVTADPHHHDGTTGYMYDAVGNRQQLIVNGVTANTYNYDADDRLGADQYDANGNTTNSLGTANSYDFENHLIQHGAVTVVYDGDGNRISETVGGVTTNYLVDTQNPTGYAQVVDELAAGVVTRTYSYGLERISETQSAGTSFYGYDGHGSVRQLTNSSGTITDTYDYDAFGNLINSTGSTPNNYLFASEQFDSALGLYYNRARYLNTATGRFWSVDTAEGDDTEPPSLHKYLYTSANPVNAVDPSGEFLVSNFVYGQQVHDEIGADFNKKIGGGLYDKSINFILGTSATGGGIRPDLIDVVDHEIYEIKPSGAEALGYTQLAGYLILLNRLDKKNFWMPGYTYTPPPIIQLNARAAALISMPKAGLITYDVLDQVEILSLISAVATYQLYTMVGTAQLTAQYGY